MINSKGTCCNDVTQAANDPHPVGAVQRAHAEPLPDALHFACEQGTELINFEAASCDVQSAKCHPQPFSLEVS